MLIYVRIHIDIPIYIYIYLYMCVCTFIKGSLVQKLRSCGDQKILNWTAKVIESKSSRKDKSQKENVDDRCRHGWAGAVCPLQGFVGAVRYAVAFCIVRLLV